VNIILFGPPGAGKGTQADNLVKDYNLFKVSTGDLLRKEIKKETSIGLKIKSPLDQGSLVSDLLITNLLEKVISNKTYSNRMIFDGYPRNLNQVKNLENLLKEYDQKISCILSLKVDLNIIIKRILGRKVCSKCGNVFNDFFNPANSNNHRCDSKFLQKRPDDSENVIKNRFATYEKETLPILNYYKNKKLLHQIDGMNKIDQIYGKIRCIIDSLEA
jgi:adenylate kinase